MSGCGPSQCQQIDGYDWTLRHIGCTVTITECTYQGRVTSYHRMGGSGRPGEYRRGDGRRQLLYINASRLPCDGLRLSCGRNVTLMEVIDEYGGVYNVEEVQENTGRRNRRKFIEIVGLRIG